MAKKAPRKPSASKYGMRPAFVDNRAYITILEQCHNYGECIVETQCMSPIVVKMKTDIQLPDGFCLRKCPECSYSNIVISREFRSLICSNCGADIKKKLDGAKMDGNIHCLKNDRDFWENAAKTEIGDILKEFAERVKEKTLTIVRSPDLLSESDYIECIDSLVEEMVGRTDV